MRAHRRDVRAPTHQAPDELGQALAVALLERRPKALAMVRQHDDPVRARALGGRLGDRREGDVDAVEGIEGFDPLGA